MQKMPYFSFYPRDWMSDPKVQVMSMEEEWAYFRLLMMCWTFDGTCTLPDDDDFIARLLRIPRDQWLEIRQTLIDGPQAVFERDEEGRLYNNRLMEEFEQASGKSKQAKEAAAKRWESKSNAGAMRTQSERNADASRTQCHPDADAEAYTEAEVLRKREEQYTRPKTPDETEKEPAVKKVSPVPYERIADLWNSHCPSLQTVHKLSKKRKEKIALRWKEHDQDITVFEEVFRKIEGSPFCRGNGPNGWRATLDWVVANDTNMIKVLEGHYYDPEPGGKPNDRASPPKPEDKIPVYDPTEKQQRIQRMAERRERNDENNPGSPADGSGPGHTRRRFPDGSYDPDR